MRNPSSIKLIIGLIFSLQCSIVAGQQLILEKNGEPEKQRIVKNSDIVFIMLDGARRGHDSFDLAEDRIILNKDTIPIDAIKKIRCKTQVGFGQAATGYTMIAAGSFFVLSGIVGLSLSISSGDSYLFPDKIPAGPPLAMIAGGATVSIFGTQLSGMHRSFDLTKKWKLKIVRN